MPSMCLERIGSNWSDTGGLRQKRTKTGPKHFFLWPDGLIKIYRKYSPVSFILNTIDVLGSFSAAPTDRNDFLNWRTVVSF